MSSFNHADLDYALIVEIKSYNDATVADLMDRMGYDPEEAKSDLLEYLMQWDNGDGSEVVSYEDLNATCEITGSEDLDSQIRAIGDHALIISHEFDYVALYRSEEKK